MISSELQEGLFGGGPAAAVQAFLKSQGWKMTTWSNPDKSNPIPVATDPSETHRLWFAKDGVYYGLQSPKAVGSDVAKRVNADIKKLDPKSFVQKATGLKFGTQTVNPEKFYNENKKAIHTAVTRLRTEPREKAVYGHKSEAVKKYGFEIARMAGRVASALSATEFGELAVKVQNAILMLAIGPSYPGLSADALVEILKTERNSFVSASKMA